MTDTITRTITNKKGQTFTILLDAEDAELFDKKKWYVSNSGYLIRSCKGHTKHFHREVMNTPDDKQTDHIDGNKLNNSKANLRICSYSENMRNKQVGRRTTSGYIGVAIDREKGNWRARVVVHGKTIDLGRYESSVEAALIRDRAALEYHGRFATLNLPMLNMESNKNQYPTLFLST